MHNILPLKWIEHSFGAVSDINISGEKVSVEESVDGPFSTSHPDGMSILAIGTDVCWNTLC